MDSVFKRHINNGKVRKSRDLPQCGIDFSSSDRSQQRMEKTGVVSQKLFANWETDRTGSSATHRVVSFGVTRLYLGFPTQQGNSLVLTAKLQGAKRTLRSNDIPVTLGEPTVDVDLDVSFTIQYPHYIKHKNNVLQIMVQRKRKYKNRAIPGGFKTLAIGIINLSQLLQHGGLREILLFVTEDADKELGTVTSVGRLNLSSCQTAPLEIEEKFGKKITLAEQDDDEEDSESEFDDVVDDLPEPSTGRGTESARMEHALKSKMLRRKNLKQRFVNLLRKFKAAEEQETREGNPSRAGSVLGTPTAQELEALFEQLEEMSDSDPVEWTDNQSIKSNPRPALRPYFTRSKEVLPAIYDHEQEFPSDTDNDPTDQELSSDDKEIAARIANSRRGPIEVPPITATMPRSQYKVSTTTSVPLTSSSEAKGVPHSQTTGSIHKKDSKVLENLRQINVQDELPKLLESTNRPVKVWLCGTETSYLAPLGLPTVYCTNMSIAKNVLHQVVARIQNFCNTNSENPPVYMLGIIGSDKTISHVLRAYVEIFNMKSSSPCLPFIRFLFIPPPQSLISHLLEDAGPLPEDLCRDVWERWPEMSPEDQAKIGIRLERFATQATGCLQIPYGEVMLQMADGNESEQGQIFVPFLNEVRMGQNDDDFETSSPRLEDLEKTKDFTPGGSPPCSPHIKGDACDLNLEYWLAKDDPFLEGSKKDKGSLKTAFKSVLIARMWNQPHLYLNFVKEKRKEKMLLKLGMKKGQRSEAETAPVHVTNVSRLLCIGSGKNNDLTVTVDGNQYRHVRYFQTTAQWQTHIKTFPIAAQIVALTGYM